LEEFQVSLEERVKDCEHYPRRLYIWEEKGFMPRSLHGTCLYCHTDYQVPPERIVELVSSRTPNDAPIPFYALLGHAVRDYKALKKNKNPRNNLP
jgi:hypothetical protein